MDGLQTRLEVMEVDDGRFFMEDLIQQGQGRHHLISIPKTKKELYEVLTFTHVQRDRIHSPGKSFIEY